MYQEEEDIIVNNNQRIIRAAITHGDFNGIGYEIILKTFNDHRILDNVTPIVFGSSKIASFYKKMFQEINVGINLVKNAASAGQKRLNFVNILQDEVKVDVGLSTEFAGKLAFQSLELACDELGKNCDVLITAPINKENIQSENFKFPGHTEYLAEKFKSKETMMIMVSSVMKIGVITGHIPITEVANVINKNLIIKQIKIFEKSLKRDFGIQKPRIALLGLNPHAGDNGVIGKEEIESIIPAINQAKEEGILANGPFPSDGFFGSGEYKKYDGILAMYHDQGLIPFKSLSFDDGVNFTTGLPIVRTSPGHGTAYDIAGKDMANESSFRSALYLACDIFEKRLEYDEINANPLGFSNYDFGKDDYISEIEGLEVEADL